MAASQQNLIKETLRGVVDRITFHSEENGWSVVKVLSTINPGREETVIVHQVKIFAGATMEFFGSWTAHPKFGRQFQAEKAIETKPATAAALEKYLGSGLIKGVGPKTAKRIVEHFGTKTLDIFEDDIDRLIEVPGIAQGKLNMIATAWVEHKAIREVMMFLQTHGISTLFAVRIFKEYGDGAIKRVTADPYALSRDFYGIGFLSADKVALSIGFAENSPMRIMAAIRHVLADSKNNGHCFLFRSQIEASVTELLGFHVGETLDDRLGEMQDDDQLAVRQLANEQGLTESCYYSKNLYYDEKYLAERLKSFKAKSSMDQARIMSWIHRYCEKKNISLSDEQASAVAGVASKTFSVLTGGPGCGKTTATLVLVKLLEAMRLRVLLAAPTGRAAQRMSEVIGQESKTIHRLLEWQGGKFKKNEEEPLECDFLIMDEGSMLDVSLAAALLRAIPSEASVLFIGDADQLPSVGAGNVLKDIIAAGTIPVFRLTKIFRQAQESLIITYAHQINKGQTPDVESPFHVPTVWGKGVDCLFIDTDEATMEQLQFIAKVKKHFANPNLPGGEECLYQFRTNEALGNPYASEIAIPDKFRHVKIEDVLRATNNLDELKAMLKKVHPWSSLNYGLSATDTIRKLYCEWIPKYFAGTEIQVLSPMTRGSMGTGMLNKVLQEKANPFSETKNQLFLGDRIFREGDRVIHRKNNYDLGVFNGDIGHIRTIDSEEGTCEICFAPDMRIVQYDRENMLELDLAYSITIHKSQGSEFGVVIIPVCTQHFKMLFRNLIYTGLTRAKTLAVFVGSRRALSMAVKNEDTSKRQTALKELLAA